MNESLIQVVRIESYTNLLRGLLNNVESITAHAVDGHILSSQGEATATVSVIEGGRSYAKQGNNLPADDPVRIWRLDDDHILCNLSIADADGHSIGTISIRCRPEPATADDQLLRPATVDALSSLVECISNEYRLASELDAMSDELSERYEELNLLYQTDEPAHDDTVGYRVIQQMLRSYIDFLDIGMVALSLPELDITLLETKLPKETVERRQLLCMAQNELFQRLHSNRQPIVINRTTDTGRSALPSIPYKLIAAPVENEEGELLGTISIFNSLEKQDFSNSDRNLLMVTAKKLAKVVLSRFDPLTGLNNHRNFELYVGKALHQARYDGEPCSILSIDIDQLRVINDVSGRAAGDKLLCHIGTLIRDHVRDQDVTARTGGDRFAVLLKNCTLEMATRIATSIQEKITTAPFLWRHKRFDITTAIGVAPIDSKADSASSVINASELACDAAKERGRNKIYLFKTEDSHILHKKAQMLWVSRIQAALREDRFLIYAQPIVALDPDQQVTHFETLLRLQCDDSSGRIIAPGAFMDAAESFFLMPDIDRWVVRNVLRTIASQWPRICADNIQFAVNLSGQSICDDGFRDFLLQELEKTPIPASVICFEITETVAIANLDEAQSLISSLKGYGCSFSLDDFGTGLSSFSYLQNLDVEYLKIDGSFVKHITNNPVSKSMVSAINQVGHAMNLKTIAEWVEDAETNRVLRAMGIDYGQGYGLGRPEPLNDQLRKLYCPDEQRQGGRG